jgi:hypothetical protein
VQGREWTVSIDKIDRKKERKKEKTGALVKVKGRHERRIDYRDTIIKRT